MSRAEDFAALLDHRSVADWQIREGGYEPALEHEIESRFAIGNGFLGLRGSLDQPTNISRLGTFIAGLFDLQNEAPQIPVLIAGPDWLQVCLEVDCQAVSLEVSTTLKYTRTLDLRLGVLFTDLEQELKPGLVVKLRALRFASLTRLCLLGQLIEIEVNQASNLSYHTGPDVLATRLSVVSETPSLLILRTPHRDNFVGLAGRTVCVDASDSRRITSHQIQQTRAWRQDGRERTYLARILGFSRGRTPEEATRRLDNDIANSAGFRRLYQRNVAAWSERWAAGGVSVRGDDEAQQALRFAVYHLTSAANPDDETVSIGAKGLTGEGYKGHVFWDTEIFLLPFYTFTWPAAARALLMYRYHTLPAARVKARSMGFRGALYAWESADTGEETTPPYALGYQGQIIPILSGFQEHHISADIAFAVWQYWQTTRDTKFLLEGGAEILLETSRFWASRAKLEEDGLYHIRNVIGPDEYHEDIDDNAYTNVMARFNIERGLETARLLKRRWPDKWRSLASRIGVTAGEMSDWEAVSSHLFTAQDAETGVFEQFFGFASLEQIDVEDYADRTAPMDVILGRERTQLSQVIKQADVLMFLTLLGDGYSSQVRQANFDYYEPRCGHGSSLSPPTHALLAAQLGNVGLAKAYFEQTAAIDLDDTMGNAAGGVHIAALGGLWQAAVFGFGGLRPHATQLEFDPHLPDTWQGLSYCFQWRRRTLQVEIRNAPLSLKVRIVHGRPLTLNIGRLKGRVQRGETWTAKKMPDGEWQVVSHGGS